jgi:hypothetical protein
MIRKSAMAVIALGALAAIASPAFAAHVHHRHNGYSAYATVPANRAYNFAPQSGSGFTPTYVPGFGNVGAPPSNY